MKQLVSKIRHYLSIYLLLAKLSIETVFIYRINSLIMGLAPIIWMTAMLVFIGVIFSKVKELGGWNYWQVVFLTGVHEIIFLLTWSTIMVNLRTFVSDVKTGRSDQDFLRPINSRFFISFKTIDFTNIGSLVNVIVIFSYSLGKIVGQINIARFFGFFLLLAIAYFICYFVYLIFASFCLYFINARALLDWIFELTDFDRYPAEIYPVSVRAFLTFFLPILFFAYIPTSFLFGKIGGIYIVYGLIVIIGLYRISSFIWHKGLKNYQSASS